MSIIDSGAGCSLISRSVVNRLKLPVLPFQLKCVSINSTVFSIRECCFVTVALLDYTACGPCGVIDFMPADLLLGNDFLISARCRINYETSALERKTNNGLQSTQIFVNLPAFPAKPADSVSDNSVVAPAPQPDQLSSPARESNCPWQSQRLHKQGCVSNFKQNESAFQSGKEICLNDTAVTFVNAAPNPPFEIIAAVDPDTFLESSPESDDESPMYFPSSNELNKTQVPPIVIFDKDFWNSIDINPRLSQLQRRQIVSVLELYPEIFPTPENPIGHCKIAQHQIDTDTNPPVCVPLRPFSKKQTQIIDEKVQELLKMGAIYKCESEYSTNLLLVKKGEKYRLCQDLRPLNRITKRNPYPVPNIEDLFQALHGSTIYSSIDLQQGYYNIEINPADQLKTAFRVPGAYAGQYCWRRMVFGLTGAPGTFCKVMDIVFRDIKEKSVLNYIDDFLTFSESFEDHVKHLHEVCRRLREAGLKINISKCKFG